MNQEITILNQQALIELQTLRTKFAGMQYLVNKGDFGEEERGKLRILINDSQEPLAATERCLNNSIAIRKEFTDTLANIAESIKTLNDG